MKEKSLESLMAHAKTSIIDAMKSIDRNTLGVLFIVDSDRHLIGAVSDGDVRRWLIKTGDLSAPVESIMNKTPKYVETVGRTKASDIMKESFIHVLPVVDTNMKIVDVIVDYSNVKIVAEADESLEGVPVVIMAGGFGTRLYPYTKILPKALIPIGDIPISERIVNRFVSAGVKDFFFTLNYRAGMIKSYFEELNPSYNVNYVSEDEPMGTAGSLRLLANTINSPFIVSNCDILINADYKQMYKHHLESENVLTAVAAPKSITIPYGVFETGSENAIKAINEKPRHSYLVNTGMYILNPDVIEMIPERTFFHMTDLIKLLIDRGKKVGIYPVGEDAFLDMGELEEMQNMENKLKTENGK